MNISDLVKDWGGFERFIAQLNETGEVSVEHNVILEGRSGAPRQIDVVVRHTQGLFEHLIIAECKYWNSQVERLHVDALATAIRETGASKGVIFSTKGFQSGAITQARYVGIDLFTVRELSDAEWGRPGRVIEIFLHVMSVAISPANVKMMIGYEIGIDAPSSPPALQLGSDDRSETPIYIEGKPDKTLELLIERAATEAASKVWNVPQVKFEDGYEGSMGVKVRVEVKPENPIILLGPPRAIITGISFDIGVKCLQSHIKVDRSASYAFAVAVENCVNKTVKGASRRKNDKTTTLSELGGNPSNSNEGDVYQNGSLMKIWTKGFQTFDDFENLEYGVMTRFESQAK